MSDAHEIRPAPTEFTADQIAEDPILRFFNYSHLPPSLQARCRPFCDLARHIISTSARCEERSVSLRKLLEAKDAAVRAAPPLVGNPGSDEARRGVRE